VIETAPRVVPDDDDLELLALFSSQAAVAIRNTHELERLRSGALAALGRMATEVAHELRNPLAGLRLYAHHLQQRLAKVADAEGVDLARKISSTVDHLADVVSDITAFGKTAELRRAAVDLHPLLDECLSLARARCTVDNVDVRRDYDARCPQGMLDARELRKAFLNLIVNGMEALRPGGHLGVSTAWDAGAGVATVVVEDDGVGMSEETASRLFDLFYTTKTDGTGLGMAIARAALEAHGGELKVASVLGQGTRMTVRLPLATARQGA
jgi:two-component system sensor histidine kinase HydH